MKNLVSIIIPTKNSSQFLEDALSSIRGQAYKKIELVIVDGKSTDATLHLARKYKCTVYTFIPDVPSGSFDATYKRNYGAKKAKGDYIYWMDADMKLPKNLIKEAVQLCDQGADAIILPEDSFGTGIWAQAKKLERRCYWGDDTVECPRFFKRTVWNSIGGLDEALGAGGDDLDIHQKTIEKGFTVARTKSIVMHNEGNLKLKKLFKKHFMYGRDTVRYFYKRPKASIRSYLLRFAYVKNSHLFIKQPFYTLFFFIMRTTEYFAGFLGFLYSFIDSYNARRKIQMNKPTMNIEAYAESLPQYYEGTIPPTLNKYLKKKKFQSLLDAGCGDGSLLFGLKERGYFKNKHIFGIDLSKNRIKIVKSIDSSIRATVDDAIVLKTIKTNSIDFYVSTFVIEHVDDKKLLDTAARVLKKGGTAYISTVFKKWYGWYYKRRNGKWVMDVTHLREYMSDSELFSKVDLKKFLLLESKKTQMSFPIIDFIIRRLFIKNRQLFTHNIFLGKLRNIKIPIIGYYEWEIILQKR